MLRSAGEYNPQWPYGMGDVEADRALLRYTRPGSIRVYANATNPEQNKHPTLSAFSSSGGFPDGGNLAVQIINNGPRTVELPVDLRGVAKVKDLVSYLLDNEHNLTPGYGLVQLCNGTITASIPPKALVVLSIRH